MERRSKWVVAALVRDRDGRVLLTQRRADQAMPLLWELPGGKIEPGESPVFALVRELVEEIGCTAEVGRIYDVIFHRYADFDLYMLVYACTLHAPPRAIEVAQLAWVPLVELSDYAVLPADVPLLARLREEG
jgi:8-oxo-dGTP diphosphatase